MNNITNNGALAVADLSNGFILSSVVIAVPPPRVYQALVSEEIIDWWVRPGVFNTTEWTGDVRVGGYWRTSGFFNGAPYLLEGKYLEIDQPSKLVQTYGVGTPWGPTTVIYHLEPLDGGTRITLQHSGFTSREKCAGNCIGWETSFERLSEILQEVKK